MARRLNPPLKNIFRKTNTKYNSEDNAVLDIQKTKCDFIVEGQTEVSYFNSLKSNNNLLFTIDKIINLKGCEGGGLFETCAKEIYKRLKTHVLTLLFVCLMEMSAVVITIKVITTSFYPFYLTSKMRLK